MIDVVLKKIEGFIPKHTTRDQAKDTGMAMTLICILIGYLGHKQYCIVCAIVLLLVTMTVPTMFRPAAKLWFGLSQMLGAVMSKILLSILFFLIVTPVGMIRRMLGKDSLQLKKWKKDSASVFRERNHRFAASDIHHPY